MVKDGDGMRATVVTAEGDNQRHAGGGRWWWVAGDKEEEEKKRKKKRKKNDLFIEIISKTTFFTSCFVSNIFLSHFSISGNRKINLRYQTDLYFFFFFEEEKNRKIEK